MPVLPQFDNRLALVVLSNEQSELPVLQWDWILAHLPIAFGIVLAALLLLWLCWDTVRLCLGNNSIDVQAKQRAEMLLRESVSPDQYQQLQRRGYLEITSTIHANRCYRIPRQRQRIQVLHSGKKIAELCVVSIDPVPDADLVLAHKLLLETDEDGYLAMANWMQGTW